MTLYDESGNPILPTKPPASPDHQAALIGAALAMKEEPDPLGETGRPTPRPCDGCTMCCKLLPLEALAKPAGKQCPNCDPGVGCTIYDRRPEECHEFTCLWALGLVPEELKPDHTKVVLGLTSDGKSLIAWLDPANADAFRRGAVGRWLESRRQAGVTIYALGAFKPQKFAGAAVSDRDRHLIARLIEREPGEPTP